MQPGGDLAPALLTGEVFSHGFRDTPAFHGERYSIVEHDAKYRIPKPNFTLGGLPVGETLLTEKDGRLDTLQFSVYNRGDNGALSDEAFVEKLRDAVSRLSSAAGVKQTPHNRKSSPTQATYDIGGFLWQTPRCVLLLEYSVEARGLQTKPAPEYIRLIARPDAAALPSRPSLAGNRVRVNPRQNVLRSPDDACEIQNIPMVDQGAKGYCAAATTARLMAYYGYEELDQHQIAQWANTTADGGTDMHEMMKGIQRVLHDKYRLVARELEPPMDFKDLQKLVERYNRAAKTAKRPQVQLPTTGVIDINDIFDQFEGDLLRKVRVPTPNVAQQWFSKIKGCIDKGIPVLWTIELGILPEAQRNNQSHGGHMRLITGYGPGGKTILFSDTWGAGHERKSMPLEDAITITTGLKTIAPTLN